MLRADAHIRALSVPDMNLILIRKTYQDLLKTHIVNLPREMQLLGGSYHASNHIAYYPSGSRLFLSYVGSDAMNVLGAEFLAGYFDELSVIPWEFFLKLSASIRVPKGSGLTAVVRAATNPLGESTEDIYHYFVDKDVDPEVDPDYSPEDWASMRLDMQDNPYLDVEQYRKRLMGAGLSANVRRAWLDGEYVPEGGIFDFYPNREGKPYHIIPDIDLPGLLKGGTVYRAIDLGWYPDPTYCLWLVHLGNRYVAIKEKLWYKTPAAQVAADIKEIDDRLGVKRVAMTFVDPTADIHTTADVRTVKDIFEQNGIPMECSINDRMEFARSINTALTEEALEHTPRLQIYVYGKEGCPYLAKTIPQMRFNEKQPEKMADHRHDHACVTLAYFLISSGASEHRPLTGPTALRPWMKSKPFKKDVLGAEAVRDHSVYDSYKG